MLHTGPRVRLEDDLAVVHELADRPAATAKDLAANLFQIYDTVRGVSFERYDLADLARSVPTLLPAIFAMRLKLREQVPGWNERGFMSLPVQKAVRDTLRISRYATDMLGELNLGYTQLGTGEATKRAFSGGDFNTLVNPKFDTGEDIPFQAGDLLLMRGMHHNSAAIARVGDVDSQFSHVGIIHTDEAGKQWVVEALIEEGSVIKPLDHDLSHGLGRCVVFRHKEAAFARRAAAQIHDLVRRANAPGGKHIWYDFTMELKGDKELFCSKLVRLAYRLASSDSVLLPSFMTRFDMKNRDFMKRIGVTAHETFAPADIELEPNFDLVAEWQDYRVTSRLRLQDLLMDKLFQWMDEHGYTFHPDFPIRLIGIFGRLSSRLSERTKTMVAEVIPRVPPNMRRSAIQAVAMLHQTAEPLLTDLLKLERASIERHGRPLQSAEVFNHLEQRRKELNGRIGYLS